MWKKDKIDGVDIISIILVLSTIGAFVTGMIMWPMVEKNGWQGKLYYITVSSSLYMQSLIIHILARKLWVKVVSALGLGVFGINLYVELFADPVHWGKWDKILILCVSLNLMLTVFLTERLKQKFLWNRQS